MLGVELFTSHPDSHIRLSERLLPSFCSDHETHVLTEVKEW